VGGDELTAMGRRKRKDTGAKREGAPPKGWTEDEERLFLEGLELYGREWKLTAAHIGLSLPHYPRRVTLYNFSQF
jgi:hypothetical protein